MRVLGFGTYDGSRQPRPSVLLEGLSRPGVEVRELNLPLGLTTAERVAILRAPWRLPRLLVRLVGRWLGLTCRRLRLGVRPDVVLVGYLAQFDVLLARVLFPRSVIVMDLLVFADDTAKDRGVRTGIRTLLLRLLDRTAIAVADVVVLDTEENLALLSTAQRAKGVVAPVGAGSVWFREPVAGPPGGPLRVVFFGLFTPLQGTPVIGAALAQLDPTVPVEVTMVGSGQDYRETRELAGGDPRISWLEWVAADDLPALVAEHDVCLGIFGRSGKATRVVPTKIFQGAAAGCALVTSSTPPQVRMLGDAAIFVPPGDAEALAAVLVRLSRDPAQVMEMRRRAYRRACSAFDPAHVAAPVAEALHARVGCGTP